jgi:hypothetical protein
LHQVGGVDQLFLQNLEQLHDNIVETYDTARDPGGHLDVATIGAHLHYNLRQSAFTDSRGHFNVTVQGDPPNAPLNNPGHPVEPFTVDSGKSAYGVWAGANDNVPMYSLVAPAVLNPAVANKAQMPFPPSNAARVNAAAGQAAVFFPALNPVECQTKILGPSASFSGNIQVAQLQPGRIIARCCQGGSKEPGVWWVSLQDMPWGITSIRSGTAVLPNWNQNGNLEFFVVPEPCNIVILEGWAASQALGGNLSAEGQRSYWQLGAGQHFSTTTGRVIPGNQLLNGGNFVDVTNRILQGGTNQIYIMENRAGLAFNGYMPCLAIIETRFDVELQ